MVCKFSTTHLWGTCIYTKLADPQQLIRIYCTSYTSLTFTSQRTQSACRYPKAFVHPNARLVLYQIFHYDTLTFLPPLSETQLKRDFKRPRRMRVEGDILRLPSCRMKSWLRKLSKIAILPILRLLKKLSQIFLPRQWREELHKSNLKNEWHKGEFIWTKIWLRRGWNEY